MQVRKNDTRGYVVHPEKLITSYRSFSCMSYQNPNYNGWGPVITINDDRAEPGFTTPWHPHRDLDIISYIIKGEMIHEDNLGNKLTAKVGQLQHMWCGDEIHHTEGNPGTETSRYLQIWIQPGFVCTEKPYYELVERDMNYGILPIKWKNPNIVVSGGILNDTITVSNSYVLVLEGSCTVADRTLEEGDSCELLESVTVVPNGYTHLLTFTIKNNRE